MQGTYVGTDPPTRENEEEGTDSDEPVEIVIDSHFGFQKEDKLFGSLPGRASDRGEEEKRKRKR